MAFKTALVLLTLASTMLVGARATFDVTLKYRQLDLQLREIQTNQSLLFTGTTFGSLVVFNDVIQDFRTNEVLGRIQGFCHVTVGLNPATGQAQLECLSTFIFNADGSTFSIAGLVDTTMATDLAIIGGTNRFSGATGVVRLSVLAFSLTPTNASPNIFAYNVRAFVLRPITLATLS